MFIFDLSLNNVDLYNGCDIQEVAGRLNLLTPVDQAVNIIGRNGRDIIEKIIPLHSEIKLTGAMAVWAYLVIFHIVVHRFARVYYDDGRGNKVLVAAHG